MRLRFASLVAGVVLCVACTAPAPSDGGLDAFGECSAGPNGDACLATCTYQSGNSSGTACEFEYSCTDGVNRSVSCNETECVCGIGADAALGATFSCAHVCLMPVDVVSGLVVLNCTAALNIDAGPPLASDASAVADTYVAMGSCQAACSREATAGCPGFDPSLCVLSCQADMPQAIDCPGDWQDYITCMSNANFVCGATGNPTTMDCDCELQTLAMDCG